MSRKSQTAATGGAFQFGTHDMSHVHLTSLDFGRIQPLLVQECVPNDDINLHLAELNITTAPNVAPMQSGMFVNVAAFYVPNRVVWEDWNEYNTGMRNLTIPNFTLSGFEEYTSNADRVAFHSGMGIPVNSLMLKSSTTGLKASLLPYRAYNRIWWDWFRDSTVVPDTNISSYIFKNTGNESFATYYANPKYACWDKDYITNNLRKPNGDSRVTAVSTGAVSLLENTGVSIAATGTGSTVQPILDNTAFPNADERMAVASRSAATSANATTINTLRTASAVQSFIECMSMIGGRVRDRVRGMFGSTVQPETLQMSEYLGSNKFPIKFETSAATTSSSTNGGSTTIDTPFGFSNPEDSVMKGQRTGDSSMTTNGLSDINYHCKEFGYFFIVCWVMPDVMLHQGMSPMWFRGIEGVAPSRTDFWTPQFVNTGFEPLYMHEVTLPPVAMGGANLGNYTPFTALGYRGKYQSYTYNRDVVGGCFVDLRTAASMRGWWCGRDFLREAGVVDANGQYVAGKTGTDIINNVNHDTVSQMSKSTKTPYDEKFVVIDNDVDHFVCQCKISLTMVRPIPAVTVPRIETVVGNPTPIGGTRL